MLEEESEEEFEEEVEEDEEEDESYAESKVIDPPYMARVPTHHWGYNDPTPCWEEDLKKWG